MLLQTNNLTMNKITSRLHIPEDDFWNVKTKYKLLVTLPAY